MTASDADRAKAAEILRDVYRSPLTGDPVVLDRIAAALAEARATERAAADQLRADMEKLAEEHRRWAVANRDRIDRADREDEDFLMGMAQAQEGTVRYLRAILDAR
jgi:hypothetical protein